MNQNVYIYIYIYIYIYWWSEKWQMLLNFGKYKFIHIGHGNMDIKLEMLGRTTKEKNVGETFSVDMKVLEQCGFAASRGNQILGLIRTITYKDKQLIILLYKAIVGLIWDIVYKHGGHIGRT